MSDDLTPHFSPRLNRRDALKWLFTAIASAALLDQFALGADPAATSANPLPNGSRGYGTDPDLLKGYKPGDLWPLTFDEPQRHTALALCATIIPADGDSPGAAEVGVADFIDEWISAPYAAHASDRELIVAGLTWLEAESQRRFGNRYVNLVARQQHAICDDICYVKTAKPEFQRAAAFFKRYRDLTAGGYYTTPAGMKAIGYTGNVPLAAFDGPPPEVLARLNLA